MKENRLLQQAAWLFLLLVLGAIFAFSAQEGDASTQSSNTVTLALFHVARKGTAGPDIVETVDAVIRMGAHVFEYMVLSAAIGLLSTAYGIRGQLRALYMALGSLLVSIADEALQTFVPARYGDLSDVVMDTLGAALVAALVLWRWKRLCRRAIEAVDERRAATEAEAAGAGRSGCKSGIAMQDDERGSAEEARRDCESGRAISDGAGGSAGAGRRAFMRVWLDDIGMEAALDQIMEYAADEGHRYVVTPNADHIVRLEKDEAFYEAYCGADLILPDGTPLEWIAASTGHPLRGRVTGADLFPRVCERAAAEGRSICLLGGMEGVAAKAACRLKERWPSLIVKACITPPIDPDAWEAGQEDGAAEPVGANGDADALVAAVNAAEADILFFCVGAPRSEIFLHRYGERMHYHVALPFGTAIDYAAGEVQRAPAWMRRMGLEWLYRFLQEPGRLFRRYFIDDMRIFLLALKYRRQLLSGGGAAWAAGPEGDGSRA